MSWTSDKVQVVQKDLDSFKEQYNKFLQSGSGIPASTLIERLAQAFGIKYNILRHSILMPISPGWYVLYVGI